MWDTTTFYAWFFSTCCHLLLMSSLFLQYQDSLPPEDLPEMLIQEKPEPKPQQAAARVEHSVPELSIMVPDQQAQQQAALPQPALPDLDDSELFEEALLKPALNSGSREQNESSPDRQENNVALPEMNIDIGDILAEKQVGSGKSNVDERSSNLHDFTAAVNVTIGVYYNRHWRKRFDKQISNNKIHLLITVSNSAISEAQMITGSGSQVFDETLLIWLHNTRVNGPPIPDGKYVIELHL